ncbi:AbrB family transcriptional regulator [Evansella tamaricis]|uniref:AbrB family transcriptional regulator n=1 Tax=Evansella tamaricis TaxID=2069301 RepID=A0ABS6JIB2_9BACI|nr:AbrB family transcriptional regulator [Evansella tamaricis]MBU9713417.1 AbrB family transcriptional regulator [Evansella tamaricis]
MFPLRLVQVFKTVLIGFIGGILFYIVNLPLPWVLGAMTIIILWNSLPKSTVLLPAPLKNSGLLIIGSYFGLYFTKDTFLTVGPYVIPYIIVTVVLVFIGIFNSLLVTRWIPVDRITSVFGSIPGGLTEMVIASESLKAQSSLVAIFQTVRLLTVLFVVPLIVVHFFSGETFQIEEIVNQEPVQNHYVYYFTYIIPISAGILLRNLLPAGIVIIPLIFTAILNISIITLPPLPTILLIFAQVLIGIGIGKNISISQIKQGGKYCFVYFLLAIMLILLSFLFGTVFAAVTGLNLPTALLSVAPGGLIEMVLTATAVGGDPGIVSSLQLVRVLLIIILVPTILKWYFLKKSKKTGSSS